VRIAFFGLPLAAVLLASDGHEIAWAAVSRKGAIGTRRLSRLVGPKRVRIVPDMSRPPERERLARARPDLLVSWFWTKKLPPGVLALAPSVGIHPSLLPRHRGPDPTFWAIDTGDETTGITAHALHDEYDTGDILAQRALRIDPSWNSWNLQRALDRPSLSLLRELVRAYAEGRPPSPVAQDERRATAAPEPTDDELSIVWSWPAARIQRRVRAAAPWPGAWTEIGDRVVTVTRVQPATDFPAALLPGEAAVRKDGIAVVRAGDGALELLEGRGEDDEELSATALASAVREARPR
jgi:methionyl-tRNA formyltransferase